MLSAFRTMDKNQILGAYLMTWEHRTVDPKQNIYFVLWTPLSYKPSVFVGEVAFSLVESSKFQARLDAQRTWLACATDPPFCAHALCKFSVHDRRQRSVTAHSACSQVVDRSCSSRKASRVGVTGGGPDFHQHARQSRP